MKSLTGKLSSGRGWALLLALLLGAGMMISACGEEDVPAPTTPAPPPAPPPAPEPEPTPEPPATPTGLTLSGATDSSITWTWSAVEGAVGYVVQAGMDETWDDTDTVTFNGAPFTTETHYTRSGLDPETTWYVRVAAAAGTVEAPLVSDFSTHVTGMTTAVPLAPAPANLRVKGQPGPNYIEWEWDPVDGVDGYQSQFSASSDFPTGAAGRQFHEGMNDTTRKVLNLASEADGYLRVRTYTGTQTDPTFGMWTGGIMGTTAEPPPAAPLAAPDGLEVDVRSDDSITLVWDSVRNAGSYEVQQREPGDGWDAANCGEDGTVEEEECVASGLDSGTDYDFQVRAVPSDTDRYQTSAWSDPLEARTSGTAPRPTPPPTSGGMGALNVEWESTAASITFLWDRVTGGEYQTAVLTPYSDDPEPCEGVTWVDQGRSTSQVVDSITPDFSASPPTETGVRGLCVRTTDEDNRRVSFVWGVANPVAPAVGTPTTEDGKTTSLPWTGINVVQDFNYAVHLVADSGREDGMFSSAAAPTNAIQKACADGTRLDDGFADVTLAGLTETVRSGIRHFTGYTLCLRYWNDAGSTSWVVPVTSDPFLNEIHTTPATPPAPRLDSGTNNADGTERTLVWTVPVRNSADVPREHGGFEAKVIHYAVRYDHDGDGAGGTAFRSTPPPTAKTCADDDAEPSNIDGGSDPWTRVQSASLGLITTLAGVQVTTTTALSIPDSTGENLGVRLCVRAIRGSAGGTAALNGPWRVGAVTTIPKQKPAF